MRHSKTSRSILSLAFVAMLMLFLGAPNYELLINDVVYDVELDKEFSISLPGVDKPLKGLVRAKETLQFKDSFVTFSYKKRFSLTETGISDGVNQLLLNSALGTVVIVQEYATVNPTGLTSFFLNELVKEELSAGYVQKTEPHTRELSDGSKLSGIKASLTKNAETIHYVVLGAGGERAGVLIAVRFDQAYGESDKELLDGFWNTLRLPFLSSKSDEGSAEQSKTDAAP